jgi:5'-AMP-activated protein kinase catalytic alpha subunit
MKVLQADSTYAAIPNLLSPEYCITVGLTLYKVQHSIYLLDFQKSSGDSFSFMTLCANIISELKTLSAANKLQQQQQQLAAQEAYAKQQAAMQQQGAPAPPS